MPKPDIAVGDLVLVGFGSTQARARVVEDRGPIGVGGRRLLRVEIMTEEPLTYEVPAEDLRRWEEPAVQAAPRVLTPA